MSVERGVDAFAGFMVLLVMRKLGMRSERELAAAHR